MSFGGGESGLERRIGDGTHRRTGTTTFLALIPDLLSLRIPTLTGLLVQIPCRLALVALYLTKQLEPGFFKTRPKQTPFAWQVPAVVTQLFTPPQLDPTAIL